MAAPTRTPFQIEQDRATTSAMVLAGKEHREIATLLGVSREQITYDVRVIKKRWETRTTMDLTNAKAQEVARIDRLEQVYWEAWEQGTEPITYQGKDGVEHVLKQAGDPRLLSGILSCIDKRCKLLGLDAPIKWESETRKFTFTFDTPNAPRSPEELEALKGAVYHTNGSSNGKVIDI